MQTQSLTVTVSPPAGVPAAEEPEPEAEADAMHEEEAEEAEGAEELEGPELLEKVPTPRKRPAEGSGGAGPSADLFRQYLREIGRIPLLTAEEEVELARRVEAGLFAEEKLGSGAPLDLQLTLDLDKLVVMGRMAKRRLIESNLRLVVSVAKRYVGRGLTMLDLVQEGTSD